MLSTVRPATASPRRLLLLAGLICLLGALLAWAALVTPVFAQQKLSTTEAKNHVGETATVCGVVVSTHFAASTKGRPTFLNLDKPYPNQIFTVLIWGSERSKFGDPEAKYANRRVCVTGTIKDYRNAPEIVAGDPSQIAIEK